MARVTYGLLASVVEHAGLNVDRLAGNFVCPAGIVSNAANGGRDIAAGICDGLAVVERLYGGEDLAVLFG